MAANSGHLKVVKALFEHNKTDPNQAMSSEVGGMAHYILRTKWGPEVVKALLEHDK